MQECFEGINPSDVPKVVLYLPCLLRSVTGTGIAVLRASAPRVTRETYMCKCHQHQ